MLLDGEPYHTRKEKANAERDLAPSRPVAGSALFQLSAKSKSVRDLRSEDLIMNMGLEHSDIQEWESR